MTFRSWVYLVFRQEQILRDSWLMISSFSFHCTEWFTPVFVRCYFLWMQIKIILPSSWCFNEDLYKVNLTYLVLMMFMDGVGWAESWNEWMSSYMSPGNRLWGKLASSGIIWNSQTDIQKVKLILFGDVVPGKCFKFCCILHVKYDGVNLV